LYCKRVDIRLQRVRLPPHRPDPNTALDETIGALDLIVRQGKALYAGVSSYRGAFFVQAVELAERRGWAPITIHQPPYNMFYRWIETDLLEYTEEYGAGVIVFSPLAQGVLTSKYLDPANPIPNDSRAAGPEGFLRPEHITHQTIEKVRKLNLIAQERGQTMAQMAIAWTLRDQRVTSSLIGARNPDQVADSVGALANLSFSEEELASIDGILNG